MSASTISDLERLGLVIYRPRRVLLWASAAAGTLALFGSGALLGYLHSRR